MILQPRTMNTKEIQKVMRQNVGSSFLGVFPRNRIPSVNTLPCSLVCNTDLDSQLGQHWIAIYLDQCGNGEYYDSYGLPPLHTEFSDFMHKNVDSWIWNTKQVQDRHSVVCGHHCIFYLIHRYKGLDMIEITSMFTDNFFENDAIVKHYVNLLG